MEPPTDSFTPPPGTPTIVRDHAPPADPITAQQREADFHAEFFWHGVPIALTIINEMFYRDFRTALRLPPVWQYVDDADFFPEACRFLWCVHQDDNTVRALRMLGILDQTVLCDEWIRKNIDRVTERKAVVQLMDSMNQVVQRAKAQPAETDDSYDGLGN